MQFYTKVLVKKKSTTYNAHTLLRSNLSYRQATKHTYSQRLFHSSMFIRYRDSLESTYSAGNHCSCHFRNCCGYGNNSHIVH
ncbi:hypothetical protein Hanom_Chr06g00505271 [Helianthus anomalus]